MDENRKPRSRVKKVVNTGNGVEKKGEGLGTGPVNGPVPSGDRREQQSGIPSSHFQAGQRPSGQQQNYNPFTSYQAGQRPSAQQQNGMGAGMGFPFSSGTQNNASKKPLGTQNTAQNGSQRPYSAGSGTQKQYHSAERQNGTGTRSSGSGTGGGKLLLIVIALVVLFGGGKISGLFGGDSGSYNDQSFQTGTTVNTQQTQTSSGNGLGAFTNLLSAFMGSDSSVYDLSSLIPGSSGSADPYDTLITSQNQTQNTTAASDSNSAVPDESVSAKARDKYTVIRGNNQDTVTILVYMCGTDLESQQGMATSDLKEMANATIGKNINLIVYTGGCKRWRNNVISSSVNQIYRISDGKFECLEQNAGNASMVNPDTLASFITYGKNNYPANRMCLIFWDHGGGSVSGYGYDEKVGHSQSMTLAGINTALKKAGVKFDFIGFDACLMATVENGLMLSQYADYMIASEETEPGVGWYYTNWLTSLSRNTSMPTVQIGKQIADDFVAVCDRQCRGQSTTLSVVDLAELQATIPEELKKFSIDTNDLIQNKQYKKVSTARGKTREFAQQSRIDQIDLVDFARNMGTDEGKALAKAVQGAVKYNKTGGNITHAYGLSIYFPYKKANKVNQMVSTYQAIGMDEEYTRCIQEFASLEVSGQVSSGTQISGYGNNLNASPNLLNSLLGQDGGYSPFSASGMEEMLGGMYSNSGGMTGSILDLFIGRSMTAEKAAEYIMENHFDPSELVWQNGRMDISRNNWSMTESLVKNVFVDDGSGFVNLGCDAEFELDGDTLVDNFDGTWLSVDGNIMSYNYMYTVDIDEDNFIMYGYAPALLNGERVNLIISFVNGTDGVITGAQTVYTDGESDTQAKMLIAIGQGDQIQFLCDYYDYDGNFRDAYKLGNPFILGNTYKIFNAPIRKQCKVTYCFTDIYQQRYWTPSRINSTVYE